MQVRKERIIINLVDLLEENQDLLKLSYSRNAKEDSSLSSEKWRTYRRKRKLARYIRNKKILCFRIKDSNYDFIFYHYLLLDGF